MQLVGNLFMKNSYSLKILYIKNQYVIFVANCYPSLSTLPHSPLPPPPSHSHYPLPLLSLSIYYSLMSIRRNFFKCTTYQLYSIKYMCEFCIFILIVFEKLYFVFLYFLYLYLYK